MDILGERKFVELPGDSVVELPPLLVQELCPERAMGKVMALAAKVVENEDLVPAHALDAMASDLEVERRRFEMAINLVETYRDVRRHWAWGASVLEWIRQCETTFESRADLRNLLRPDVWPHAGRSSFVTLLGDKSIETGGVDLVRAVGFRLTYRHLPPLSAFSDQFLFYLSRKLAGTAYETWSAMSPAPVCSLPPERFHLHVVQM